MTKEEHKLYHKQKSHEHYLAHKEEYRQKQADPELTSTSWSVWLAHSTGRPGLTFTNQYLTKRRMETILYALFFLKRRHRRNED